MTKILATIAIAGSLASATAVSASPPQRDCREDQRCWNWATMGNMERGVYISGRKARVIVAPCRFAYLDHSGRINWGRTASLRGDGLARKHGCNPRYFAPAPAER